MIGFIVAPLMMSQLMILALLLKAVFNELLILNALLLAIIWWVTFRHAVPLHNVMNGVGNNINNKRALINLNWYRTIGWTVVLVISLIDVY